MTALWIAPILAGLIVAWRRYGKVVAESAPGNPQTPRCHNLIRLNPGVHTTTSKALPITQLFERSAKRPTSARTVGARAG